MINYHNKIFKAKGISANAEVTEDTLFHYRQVGNIVMGTYQGSKIKVGQLIAITGENGNLDMRYQHVNKSDEIMTGTCTSVPEILENGKIRLHEKWQWTSGDLSTGSSIIEEV
ncbi:MAG: hypothetical protein ABIY51_03400 [Ferruginibacter sp.]